MADRNDMNPSAKKRELEKELAEIDALLQRQDQRRNLLNKIRAQSTQPVRSEQAEDFAEIRQRISSP